MTSSANNLAFTGDIDKKKMFWNGAEASISFDEAEIKNKLLQLELACFLVTDGKRLGVATEGEICGENSPKKEWKVAAFAPEMPVENLGDSEFRRYYGARYSYYAGSMAHGISSEALVAALGRSEFLASYGAGGIVPNRLEEAIRQIQKELPGGPFAFNLIYNPFSEALEREAASLYLRYGVTTVEASAYIDLTPYVVQYRAAGLILNSQNQVEIKNKIIAKASRREVIAKFLEPAPDKLLQPLLEQKLITETQAKLAKQVPMADDITVEADSGGHTDNRPLISLLPSIIALRDEFQEKYNYQTPIRVGAAGGIGTPESALAAFMMGAAYVATGSVNQGSLEAGTSDHVRTLLSQVEMPDVIMAPAFDMFEMGGRLQVIKRGTLFPMRAQKLADLYKGYGSLEEIPEAEKTKLEKQIFLESLNDAWTKTADYWNERDPEQVDKALNSPKKKMALVFRRYLGLASRWANEGEKGREMDYQVWCGPSMGAFNDWVRGSYLEDPQNRSAVDIARHIMNGAAFLCRLQQLKFQQIQFPVSISRYIPQPFQE